MKIQTNEGTVVAQGISKSDVENGNIEIMAQPIEPTNKKKGVSNHGKKGFDRSSKFWYRVFER